MNSISAITLLIVDDEAEIRTGLRSIIPWEDYSVTVIGTAASGAEALDKIRYYEPNIVITDAWNEWTGACPPGQGGTV